MSWKVYDYECPACSVREERLVNGDEPQTCAACGGDMARLLSLGPPPVVIVKGNGDYKDRERERLEARSREHWQREGKAEAIDRIRMRRKIDGV